MRTFLAYLWKEWRDHRPVLLGMILAVPVLMVVAGLTLPTNAFEDETFTVVATLGCLGLFVFAISTDLVPGEARRGRLAFLRRQPRGLSRAFLAKFVFFCGLACAFTAYGFLAGGLTSWLVAGFFPAFAPPEPFLWLVVIVVLWIFAVSCCLPRGVLAIPATAGLCLLLLLPMAFLLKAYPNLGWLDWGGAGTVVLWLGGGVAASWLAFVRGRRHGGGALRSARWCGAIALVCVLPFWADAAVTAYQWHYDSTPVISDAFVGEGGHYAFVNRYLVRPGRNALGRQRMAPVEPLVVDLHSGVARPVGDATGRFYAADRLGWWRTTSARSLLSLHSWTRWTSYDGRTGEPIEAVTDEIARAEHRTVTPYRLADGRRVWAFRDRLECDAPQGGFEVVDEKWRDRGTSPCGLGVLFHVEFKYYDFDRRRFYRKRDLPLKGHQVLIRRGRWLVFRRNGTQGRVWLLLDPDTRVFAPARGLGPRDHVEAVHDDGRLLVRRPDVSFALIDPEAGAVQELELPSGVTSVRDAGRALGLPVRTPRGRRVFRLYEDTRMTYAYFDDATHGFVAATATQAVPQGYASLLACVGEDQAILLVEDRELWRVRFGTDEHEVLYRVR